MWYWKRMERIKWSEKVTNEQVLECIGSESNSMERYLSITTLLEIYIENYTVLIFKEIKIMQISELYLYLYNYLVLLKTNM